MGGRLKTDYEDGFRLDHGFQVLLTGYKEVHQYLDLEALKLGYFEPGAIVFEDGIRYEAFDPLRDWTKLIPMAFSGLGTLKDKFLIWKLTRTLQEKQVEQLFERDAVTTIDFLKQFGFSEGIINRFFKPFFGGIFLENDLSTSSNMFRFVFKMFSEGMAAIPRSGIQAIAEQLAGKLKQTEVRLNTEVAEVKANSVHLTSGEEIPFHRLIIATAPNSIVPELKGQEQEWHSTLNLYFKTIDNVFDRKAIALVADDKYKINNFCEISDIVDEYSPANEFLVSVTLKDHVEWDGNLPSEITKELEELVKLRADSFTYVKHFEIPKALPKIDNVVYNIQPTQTLLREHIFIAGDYLLNGSLDAAMRSGRLAAEALLGS